MVRVGEGQKTEFASYFLKREANYWWESKRVLDRREVVAWDRFTELFLEKYLPHYMQNPTGSKNFGIKTRKHGCGRL